MAPPPLLPVVFLFGLIHGFGLSTRLQEMALARDPDLFEKIVAFNIGVELGQVAALPRWGRRCCCGARRARGGPSRAAPMAH
jgi:hypothetical protein